LSINYSTGMQSRGLFQATIKWEGCGRKSIRCKNGGTMQVGAD